MKYIYDKSLKKKLSKIALGGGRLGSNISEDLSFRLLDVFYANGGTVLDTARSYSPWLENGRGKSERCIGKWIETNKARENVVVVTKGGIKADQSIDNSKDNLLRELEESLEALRTDYIDIYLLHKDDVSIAVEEIVDTMQLLKERIPIRKLGVSNMKYERFSRAIKYAEDKGIEPFSVLQTWWSLSEYTSSMWNDETSTHMDDEMYGLLKQRDMVCMAYTSQCKGYFQKYIKEGDKGISSFLKERIETPRNLKKAIYIKDYCKKNSVNPTAFINGYITSNPLKGIAIISCSNEPQMLDVMENCDYVLPRDIMEQIDKI